MATKYSVKILQQKDIDEILKIQESWLIDKKGKDIKPSKLSRTISAFANTNGGDIYLGISHTEDKNEYFWDGFINEEQMNDFITMIDNMFSSYEDYSL